MKSEVPEELKSVVGRTDKERVSYWNTLRDWLKHHNSDMPNQIVIERYDAELMIARAITKIDPHPSTLSPDQFRLLKRFYELMLTDMPRG